MAMIKCPTCHKTTSDNDRKCAHCGNELNNGMQCPKCNSKDVKLIIKDDNKGTFLTILVTVMFGWIAGIFSTIFARDKVKIRYVCNNCGKKFRLK